MKRFNLVLVVMVLTVLGISAYADVPKLINYQGRLLNSLGNPVTDSTYSVTFTIWDVPAGGSPLWSEMQIVTTKGGLFSVQLGTFVTLPDNLFDGTSRYVGITVSPDPEMPRQRLVSTPYSYRVRTVDGATGGIISGNTSIQSDLTVSGNVGVGTAVPAAKLNVLNGNIRVGSQLMSAGIEFYPALAGTPTNAGTIEGVFGNNIAIMPVGNVGIGTTSPAAGVKLDVNGAIKGSTFTNGASPIVTGNMVLQPAAGASLLVVPTTNSTTSFQVQNDAGQPLLNVNAVNGNVGIGTTSPAYKLEVSGPVMMEDAATPSASSGHSGIYSSSGELFALDGAGNSTQLSPHDTATGEWIFYSKNVKTGRVVRVDMERLVRKIEEITGEQFLMESWEK